MRQLDREGALSYPSSTRLAGLLSIVAREPIGVVASRATGDEQG